jgi:hypothetical protein
VPHANEHPSGHQLRDPGPSPTASGAWPYSGYLLPLLQKILGRLRCLDCPAHRTAQPGYPPELPILRKIKQLRGKVPPPTAWRLKEATRVTRLRLKAVTPTRKKLIVLLQVDLHQANFRGNQKAGEETTLPAMMQEETGAGTAEGPPLHLTVNETSTWTDRTRLPTRRKRVPRKKVIRGTIKTPGAAGKKVVLPDAHRWALLPHHQSVQSLL